MINIGDELLRGDIPNTNAQWIARKLWEKGIQISKIIVVGDDLESIKWAVRSCEEDLVILTGGLGPTHDDITRQGLASALGLELELNPQAREMVERYGNSALVMANLPKGAIPIPNPVGAAPGFILGKFICLPGVPSEMQAMFSQIEHLFEPQRIHFQRIHIALPEIKISNILSQAQSRFRVKIGSYPKPGMVEILIQSEDPGEVARARDWIQEMISKLQD